MSKKKRATKEPIHLEALDEEFDAKGFASKLADKVADHVVEEANKLRAKKGLPPLPES